MESVNHGVLIHSQPYVFCQMIKVIPYKIYIVVFYFNVNILHLKL